MKKFLTISALLLLSNTAFAWETIGDGIEYQQWSIAGPNNVFVTRMDRSNTNAGIAMTQANDSYKGNQTVRSQMSDNDGRMFFDGVEWGKRYKPIAGVNGDAYLSGGTTRAIRINDGHLTTSMYHDDDIWGAFYWTADRQALHSSSYNKGSSIALTYGDNTTVNVVDVNVAAADNSYTMYNAKYGLRTPSDSSVRDMLVHLGKPNTVGVSTGTVRSFTSGGGTVIPFDCCVITAKGTAATEMTSKAKVGDTVTINISAFGSLANHTTRVNLPANTLAAVTGWQTVLENGVIMPYPGFGVITDRHPRTVVAYNNQYVFFMVCDGRRSGVSIGMTGAEMGDFCKNTLGATNAVCLDGGGSSTMVTNGTVRNRPSDGSERAVANGLMMYNILPKSKSSKLSPCQQITASASSLSVRRGPGTNYSAITTVSSGTSGRVTTHTMNGIMSGGIYWWEVKVGSTTGWVSETYLTAGAKDTTAPGVPSGLKQKSVTGTTITMSWNASSDNSGYMGHYNIYRNNTLVGTSETTEYTDTGLAQDTSYSYRVSAVDFVGNESGKGTAVTMSTHFDETPPTVPQNLRMETATNNSVTFAWDASTDDTAVTGYNVYRGTRLLGTVRPANRKYTDTGLSATSTYSYYVEAFDAQNNTSAKSAALKLRCYKTDYTEGFPNLDNWTVDRASISGVRNHGSLEGDNSVYVNSTVSPYLNSQLGLGYRTGRFGVWFYDSGTAGSQTLLRLRGMSESGEEVMYIGIGIHSTFSTGYCGEIAVPSTQSTYFALSNRSAGWHHLEIEILPGGRLVFYVDGSSKSQRVNEAVVSCAFKQVYIGNNVSPSSGELYIDDITFDERTPDAPTSISAAAATPTSITWGFNHASDNAVKYMIYDGGTLKAESAMWLTKAVEETGLTPNTKYTRKAASAAGNMTSTMSYSANGYTLAMTPCDDTISYTAPGVLSDPTVVLNALTPYGAGTVSYYRVHIDNLPTREFTDTETQWNSAAFTADLPISVRPYYIHIRAYNAEGTGGDVMNIGPYTYGGIPVSVIEARNMIDGNNIMISDAVVTAVFADCAYIMKDGFGIKVTPALDHAVGDVVTVAGVLSTVAGERVVNIN
ncbi:MAG: phosphodiester glycosidase family protein [Abditibacteriota bacterium]|nr:phosphodiester glycosidase family protein [Abditibacteriota bacterium]